MKTLKYFLPFIALILFGCPNEPAAEKTADELASEIARTWNCEVVEDGFPLDFQATISVDPTVDGGIIINNFHNSSENVKAVVKSDYSIEVPEQTFGSQSFLGTGSIRENLTSIFWDYTVTNQDGNLRVTGTFTYGTTS